RAQGHKSIGHKPFLWGMVATLPSSEFYILNSNLWTNLLFTNAGLAIKICYMCGPRTARTYSKDFNAAGKSQED
ncbi:MAG: hypothetical protein JXA81_03605, partial [Sedimentisphaerales bacterium]|nr:hypothetical protein [Sedimentisphaerales bacterium]